ncbi:MAG: hypothetical protein ACC628_24175 [Pirellulaceae bacterium]
MRLLFLAIVLGLPAVCLICAAYFGYSLAKLVDNLTAIECPKDLDVFKRAVSWNMYVSVAVIGLVIVVVCVFAIGLCLGALYWADAIFVLCFGPAFGFAGAKVTKIERKVRSIPVTNTELEPEHERVIHIWKHKMFPDW